VSVEFSLSGKLLELLKQIVPDVKLVAVIRDTIVGAAAVGQFGAIQVIAPSLGVEVRTVDARDADEIERSVAAFARTPKSGLVIPASASAARHCDLIVAIAARPNCLPSSSKGVLSPPAA
jgi:putative ABC transport system substrate-binding protein